ncbi:MAG UNVERIFIED_CONTAM: hypothetical protein LOD86_04800, partial [Thermobifida fusca]
MTGAIIAAALGAVAFATGAALQERAILGGVPAEVSGQWELLRCLLRSPLWLIGTGLSGIGTVAHVWALTGAPLMIVQPIGVGGLLCAVVVSAVLTFLPIHFLHPVRVQRLRALNLTIFFAWCAFAAIVLINDMQAGTLVKAGIGLTGLYLYVIGG